MNDQKRTSKKELGRLSFALCFISMILMSQSAAAKFEECSSAEECYQDVCNQTGTMYQKPAAFPFIMKGQGRIKGSILLVHGLADSPYMVAQLAEIYRDQGYNTVAIGLSGHGVERSENGFKLGASAWRKDLDRGLMEAQQLSETGKVCVSGFSTGGALALDLALRNSKDVQCLLLFDPAVILPKEADDLGFWERLAVGFGFRYAEAREKLGSDNSKDLEDPARGAVVPEQMLSLVALSHSIQKNRKTVTAPTLTFISGDQAYIDSKRTSEWLQDPKRVQRSQVVSVIELAKQFGHDKGDAHRALPVSRHIGAHCGKWNQEAVNGHFDKMSKKIQKFLE